MPNHKIKFISGLHKHFGLFQKCIFGRILSVDVQKETLSVLNLRLDSAIGS